MFWHKKRIKHLILYFSIVEFTITGVNILKSVLGRFYEILPEL